MRPTLATDRITRSHSTHSALVSIRLRKRDVSQPWPSAATAKRGGRAEIIGRHPCSVWPSMSIRGVPGATPDRALRPWDARPPSVLVLVAPEQIQAALTGIAEGAAQAEAGADLVLDPHRARVLTHTGDRAEALGVAHVQLVADVAADLEPGLLHARLPPDLEVEHVQGELIGQGVLELSGHQPADHARRRTPGAGVAAALGGVAATGGDEGEDLALRQGRLAGGLDAQVLQLSPDRQRHVDVLGLVTPERTRTDEGGGGWTGEAHEAVLLHVEVAAQDREASALHGHRPPHHGVGAVLHPEALRESELDVEVCALHPQVSRRVELGDEEEAAIALGFLLGGPVGLSRCTA